MEVFLIILVIIIVIVGITQNQKAKKRRNNSILIRRIENYYEELTEIVIDTYDLKVCPKCHETRMDLLKISPTGKSVEYSCDYCGKKITSKLLPDKDGYEAADLIGDIKLLLERLDHSVDATLVSKDIDVSFEVQPIESKQIKKKVRSSISESVRNEVWRRDHGKCVDCGSQEKLEFDHIIPVSKGGSNTARNLQLLCETCNRTKSNKIG